MTQTIKNEKLSPEIKKSLAVILIGNFLEFFDLLLAVHMTLVLTKVFLPPDSSITPLLATFTFCSSFCIRPIAALFWGYIGDSVGRVPVLISTTFLMSISCILIPNIPSYAEWGSLSTILFLFLRLVQGFASGGECIAADVFIAETVPKPMVYFCSALVEATASFGGLMACGIGMICLTLSPENGWKIPFYIGSAIAVLGTIARKILKETPEFLKTLQNNAKRRTVTDVFSTLQFKNRNLISLFLMYLFPSVAFFFSLAFIPSLLEREFGIPTNMIMLQTTLVLAITMGAEVFYGYLGLKFHPFKILKMKLYILMAVLPFVCLGFLQYRTPLTLFFVQVAVNTLGQGLTPAYPIITKTFPVVGRYTSLLIFWAISHSMFYLFTGYVCESINNFYIISALLFMCVVISLIGVFLFRQEEAVDKYSGDQDPNNAKGNYNFYEKDKKVILETWIRKNRM